MNANEPDTANESTPNETEGCLCEPECACDPGCGCPCRDE